MKDKTVILTPQQVEDLLLKTLEGGDTIPQVIKDYVIKHHEFVKKRKNN